MLINYWFFFNYFSLKWCYDYVLIKIIWFFLAIQEFRPVGAFLYHEQLCSHCTFTKCLKWHLGHRLIGLIKHWLLPLTPTSSAFSATVPRVPSLSLLARHSVDCQVCKVLVAKKVLPLLFWNIVQMKTVKQAAASGAENWSQCGTF